MSKFELTFDPPLMNAAGMLGFTPDPHGPVNLQLLGAFITNPISLEPRRPAQGKRYLTYLGGFMIHTGYPNPGLEAVLRLYATRWRRSEVPVLAHLIPQNAQEADEMVRRLEGVSSLSGLEIGIPPWSDIRLANEITQAAIGELPIIVRLPFKQAVALASELPVQDIAGISIGPPRGVLPNSSSDFVHGRLYGPPIFPQALAIVSDLASKDLPVIGAGGVYSQEQEEIMLVAGAIGVQLDAILWRSVWF
jgi:dihydroorotate dehydrogenase (NAD+) catalytic subunit